MKIKTSLTVTQLSLLTYRLRVRLCLPDRTALHSAEQYGKKGPYLFTIKSELGDFWQNGERGYGRHG